MKIAVLGGHGKIAMHLHPILKQAGHQVHGLIRNPDHANELRQAGATPVLCDVEKEDDISEMTGEADAVIFAAGAGPGSGKERKWSVDYKGAIKLMEAARKNGTQRYIMISAMKVEEPRGNEVFQEYQKAKSKADAALRDSELDYTILRPGRLMDEEGNGLIALAPELPAGEIPRKDVARVIAALLESDPPVALHKQLDLIRGSHTVEKAITLV
jgi:uncharacterized protein YbjT (DUF2867 family)